MAAAAQPGSRGCGNCLQCLVTQIPGPTVWKSLLLCGLKQRNRPHTKPIKKGKKQGSLTSYFPSVTLPGPCRLLRGSWTVRCTGRGSGMVLDRLGREVGGRNGWSQQFYLFSKARSRALETSGPSAPTPVPFFFSPSDRVRGLPTISKTGCCHSW